MADAMKLIEENGPDSYNLAVSCLSLQDACDGQVIDHITEYQIPTLVFTAEFNEHTRDQLLKKPGVVDYVVKRKPCHAALSLSYGASFDHQSRYQNFGG